MSVLQNATANPGYKMNGAFLWVAPNQDTRGFDRRSAASKSWSMMSSFLPGPGNTGVSETLCMRLSPRGFDGSSVEPFWV